ncbi:MAG: 30S ribosomal protein S12 methylthiotransferase RimO [Lachnospiraceae bacterium]|nr:30S ribosomal protein S12 methylthiotransferase RimO [Lachnospiraceae bacterium]
MSEERIAKQGAKVLFISLGCDKNLVDSEVMMGLLQKEGYVFTEDEYEAEVIVVNTCCFIGDAKEESVNTILAQAQHKEDGQCKLLIVCGCLAERYRKDILTEIPEVDAVIGTSSFDHIVSCIAAITEGKQKEVFCDLNRLPEITSGRMLSTGGHYAYLKIAEGCNKRCTYCIIPSLRGSFRSYPMEMLLSQARELAAQGVKELLLVAQETTLYGMDLYRKKSLHVLLRELCKVDGIEWIRILYCYPEEIYEDLIQTMKEEEKICHYLDLPIQHSSDHVLKAMHRKTSEADLRKIIAHLREEIPDICLRTSLIAGFPGETKEDHEKMLDFVDEMEFGRLGCFSYSPEEDTPAYSYPGQHTEEEKDAWRDEIMELQQAVSYDLGQEKVGETYRVMIEGRISDEEAFTYALEDMKDYRNIYVGRTYMDAPGVDGYIFLRSNREFMTGDFVMAKVTGAMEYDLIGELIDEDELTQ